MIQVEELLSTKQIPGNYFAPQAYVRSDLELGLLENRQGDRLLALPESLIAGIYLGLEAETGKAARLVLFNCGRWWGRSFYRRFCEEITDFYRKALPDMEMIEFLQCLQQCWETHGWGKLELDHSYYDRGFLHVKTWHSPFAQKAPNWNRPACFLETGILEIFFSKLTGKELRCVQIDCESMGADYNRFLLGLKERIEPAESWVESGMEPDAILERLCQPKS